MAHRHVTHPGANPAQANRRTIVALAFVAMVAVLLVWVVAPGERGPTNGAAGTFQAATHQAGTHRAGTHSAAVPVRGLRTRRARVPAGTAVPAGTGTGLVVAPTDVTWRLYDGVALPYSTGSGPTTVTADGVVSGFADTPEGALIAVIQIAVRHLLSQNWQAVTTADVAAGPGRDAYVALRQSAANDSQMPAVPGHYLQVAGFSFVSYSDEAASVNVVSRSTTGSLQVVTDTVSWQGGDWKLVLQPDGSAAPSAISVSSLAGYVTWGGVF